jgi:hypothetical protein
MLKHFTSSLTRDLIVYTKATAKSNLTKFGILNQQN